MRHFTRLLLLIVLPAALMLSCSTKKNTAQTRRWHAFTARFNTYFNGHEAFVAGEQAKQEGHTDDFTELLPVFYVSQEKSRTLGKTNYETAITKCQKAIQLHSIKKRPQVSASKRQNPKTRAYLQRKEFNPFLKHAWLLMGQAQFEKGEFLEAATTFAYIARLYAAEPLVASEARLWLARCYSQTSWFYDAEEALSRVRRDSTTRRLLRQADVTQADMLLRQGRLQEALPYLQRTARYARPKVQKARMYYLLGQVNHRLGQHDAAYKALRKCERLSPPFQLAFNARILQTEVLAQDARSERKMITRLKRMARQENNKDYLDQVYFALGNIYMVQKDTAQAIAAYEKGRAKGTRSGVEKGMLLLRLAEVYWEQRRFSLAQKCYTEALGMIDKTRSGYEQATHRSKVLDKLVPHTEAIHLQDSLLALAVMSEADRNAAIDRQIEILKRKEAEEKRARADSAAQARAAQNGQGNNDRPGGDNPQQNTSQKKDGAWYFYNPMLVMQGKQDFKKYWGKRANEDNWRRSDKSVVRLDDEEGFDYAADDSLQAAADSLQQHTDEEEDKGHAEAADDPHKREYYMAQIPFSPEAKAEAHAVLSESLFAAGIIEKDDLADFPLAEQTLQRLVRSYPDFEQRGDAFYHLFLLYSRWGRHSEANAMRDSLAWLYPQHEQTPVITAPDFEYRARFGREIEDSLYTLTYKAYRARQNAQVAAYYAESTDSWPKGANRPKFMLLHVLSRLHTADAKTLAAELRELLQQYPESDVSEMAGMLAKGLEAGRQIGTGTFDIGSLWSRRTATADSTMAGALAAQQFTAERTTPFACVIAYPTDSLDTNTLLYEMAHFNFSTFVVRGFDMQVQHEQGLSQFAVTGFQSYDEAHAYAQRLYAAPHLRPLLSKARLVLISANNLKLLGTRFSYDDYRRFFDEHFAPIEPDPSLPIEQQAPVKQIYEDELTPEQLQQLQQKKEDTDDDDEGEWY